MCWRFDAIALALQARDWPAYKDAQRANPSLRWIKRNALCERATPLQVVGGTVPVQHPQRELVLVERNRAGVFRPVGEGHEARQALRLAWVVGRPEKGVSDPLLLPLVPADRDPR